MGQIASLDMPSRLKGIETSSRHFQQYSKSESFGYAFPFEGELKLLRKQGKMLLEAPLDMPSRLKGIETFNDDMFLWRAGHFGYAFPFEGN